MLRRPRATLGVLTGGSTIADARAGEGHVEYETGRSNWWAAQRANLWVRYPSTMLSNGGPDNSRRLCSLRQGDQAGRARVLDTLGQPHFPEQRSPAVDLSGVRVAGTPARDVAHLQGRTYSSWSHDEGVPGKVVAQLMGHANVDTTLNVYTQVLDGSLRAAVETVGTELFTIVHKPEGTGALSH